jgi:hypothetical protein
MHRFPQESHGPISLLRVGSLTYRLFPDKMHESWTHIILLLGFGLDFENKETTETRSNSNLSRQQ